MSHTWRPPVAPASVFLSPGVVIGGNNSSLELASVLAAQLGVKDGPILLAIDDAVKSAGLIAPVEAALQDAGYAVQLRGGFGAEPTDEIVNAVANEARSNNVQAVIGVGGGSVLDSAKLVALLLKNEGLCADWTGVVEPANGVAPLVLVPTTCGTGAEATRIAMVTIGGNKRASSCSLYVPRVAVLDPVLVSSLPGKVVAATGMDALAHATEALMSATASPLSAHHSLRAIELLVDHLEAASQGDQEALGQVLWASHFAGQALNAGVVLGHSLAYCLAHANPMPHGVSCAMALPYCIAYNQNLEPSLAKLIANALTAGQSNDLQVAAKSVAELAGRMGLPTTLADAGIGEDKTSSMAQLCVADYQRPTNPEPMTLEAVHSLFDAMISGDIAGAFSVTAR
ncbi:iron-containing alcohol dehydrogenase [Paeniglutamicibacter sulfureus]|uniref:iron-containing alcohol dehydrogenase n=1 Tax=Paeniglutamicibacter sulfureus TaxID=43666 RepID=UPI0026671536|nr:iron-containing alcohol dehydrogenase [Paeniglutamicibacter sulfureus]MDO2934679.1 iron-containing alcohol dehydrogenase [Paeniglutamicibacter sulfureus]